ncbi:DEAD-box ATP-dependent RNA helicase 42-like [Haliotis rubra]|uniref:DEAD-box ATP-dependent RNA helicase 42-like n=1 Tax=Haliotis rubra TaxID=36100 RepID=UPI001EE5B847|nr:DEAD-box ATP-dependent RNA helicase 42-like [Haliotis rubra]
MTSEMYECSKCYEIGKRETLIEHFIRTHLSHEEAPWTCSLCDFKAVSLVQLHCHTNRFRHQEALKQNPVGIVEYKKSKSPYEVQVGRDIFLYREDEPVYGHSRNKVIEYNHESACIVVGSCMGLGNTHGQTESDKDKEGERNTRERTRSQEGGGSTSKRRKTMDKREGNDGKRKRKSEDREGKVRERKRKSAVREGKGRERKKKSESREENSGERKRKTEDREGNTIERRYISSGEQNGKNRRQQHRTSEPDQNIKLNKKPKLTSSRGQHSYTWTKLDLPVSDAHQNLRREYGHVVTNDSGAKEKTKTMKNLEEDHGIGMTKIHNEAQKATTFFTERTEEPAMSFSSEEGYNLASEPEESEEVKVAPDTDTDGQTSRSGIEGEPEVRAPWEEGALVEKITELTQSLEPLRNISKALIALDHHMRRLLPLVNQILTGPPSSTAGLGAVRK